ncbi:hypothetical protein Klosneuvirus_5_14 [Klosneuvirus KNV1]|uniref:Uncharacterized protein n=1 Tax=Klosneuvirus KNV1 TaxID=1977640 RepID=A0A1V0SL39_9VIRU|nr:hypothetical protein Klosneuvirus_5_14 [Klosneuvirus KNV1]
MIILILTLILFLIGYILYKWAQDKTFVIEGMDSSSTNQGSQFGSTERKPYIGTFSGTFNGRMAIDDQYFYDKLFDNTIYYPNKYAEDDNLNDVVKTGWDKCLEECKGKCIEYGVKPVAPKSFIS